VLLVNTSKIAIVNFDSITFPYIYKFVLIKLL
jgi:hypothetical protein